MGISTDDADTVKRFRESLKLPFPLLSDKGGAVSSAWGVLRGETSQRYTFIVDPSGTIVHVEHDQFDTASAMGACPMKKTK